MLTARPVDDHPAPCILSCYSFYLEY